MSIHTIRTSRKRRYCDECRGVIEPGDRYVDSRLPPYDRTADIDNTTWWRNTFHIGAYPWDLNFPQVDLGPDFSPAGRPREHLQPQPRPRTVVTVRPVGQYL